ncbi:glycoside hydrolase/deacetylase [Piromyces finnis]|uniref:Glycoside hydrolase/deacetylase n=1 Tax=Piromyces finnis TaxID=1754191 RepID=A0A1Y1VDR6_9FUNG|nr:glycoside hydrolase/deacetylase [Piromyces finnis]|eukprot:ORX52883.1 glycoside hydrolase/deacetylase [Piromyces finnis]
MANAQKIYECVQNNTIALTYDDGPFEFSKQLVDYLTTKPDVKVTFFAVGKFHYPFAIDTQEYQDVMKKAHDVGYQIASHTFEHKLYINDTDLMRDALTKQDDFIEKVTGDRPKYFRAPKGDCGEECQSTLESWGYKTIQWDTDTLDWDLEGAGSQEKRAEESIQYLQSEFAKEKSSYLILMHDTENATVSDITPWIIEKSGMKEKGYRFVTVAECLGDKNGMYVSGKVYGDEEEKKKEEAKIKSEEIAKTAAIHSGVEYSTKLTSFITLIVAITFISLIY